MYKFLLFSLNLGFLLLNLRVSAYPYFDHDASMLYTYWTPQVNYMFILQVFQNASYTSALITIVSKPHQHQQL